MHRGFIFNVFLLSVGLLSRGTFAAPAAAEASPPAKSAPPAGVTNATAIPLAEIAAQAESASATLQTIGAELSNDKTGSSVQQELPALTQEISARLEENSRVLSRNPSLDLLRRLNSEWQEVREELADWKRELTRRATQIEGDIKHLAELDKTWGLTRGQGGASNMPPELSQKVAGVVAQIKETRAAAEQQQALTLTLQSRVTEQDARVSQAISAIEHARHQTVGHLLVRDTPPLWSFGLHSHTAADVAKESHHSFSRQVLALETYAKRKSGRFVLHAAIFLALVAIIILAQRKLRGQSQD